MSGTISGNYKSVVTLSPATPKVTVTGTINAYGLVGTYTVQGGGGPAPQAVDAALFGAAGTIFTISNAGLIETHGNRANNPFDAGIVLGEAGSVTNTGTIRGGAGIAMFGTAGTAFVSNSRLIVGSLGTGVYLQSNGTVRDSGTIKGGQTGIELNGGLVSVAQTGLVEGVTRYGVEAQGAATVQNAGSITGYADGVYLSAKGSVSNTGKIADTAVSPADPRDAGILLAAGGTVTNTGAVSGQNGINIFGTAAAYVKNTGTIAAYNSTSNQGNFSDGFISYGVGVYMAGAGKVVNAKSISGNHVGIVVENGLGTVANTGKITSSKGYGVYLHEGGSVNNSGTIIGYQQGIFAGYTFAITNSGYIDASATKYLTVVGATYVGLSSGIIAINGPGTIDNAASGVVNAQYGLGIELYAETEDFATDTVTADVAALTNAGLIKGRYGAFFYGIGAVTNTGTVAAGAIGVELFNSASIVNDGKIEATFATFSYETTVSNAVAVKLLAGGTLTNSAAGLVSAPNALGVELVGTIAGTILNAGTITGQYGVQALATASLYLDNSGTIDGTSFDAVLIADGTASLVNTGTLDGLNDGVVAVTNATINNSGLIEATRTILTTLNGYTFAGIGIDLIGGGYIDNHASAVISGGQIGVILEDHAGIGVSLNNAGLIETSNATFVTGSGTFGGLGVYAVSSSGITNTGTITGREIGITTKLAPIALNNSGLIEGTGTTFISGANTYAAGGVFMADGGTVINDVGGTIIGYGVGVQNAGAAPATVTNSGLIQATGTGYFTNALHRDIPGGVALNTGGTLTNEAGGRVTGEIGVYAGAGTTSFAAYVDNLGSMSGFGIAGVVLGTLAGLSNAGQITGADYGVILGAAGQVTNQSAGTISGDNFGLFGANTAGGAITVVNDGLMEATGTTFVHGSLTIDTAGIQVNYGGTVTNQTAGSVAGYIGVAFNTGGTLTNAGTVTGRGGTAVSFAGTQASKLIIDPGASFGGKVVDNAATGTIELAAGGSGTLAGFATAFTGFTQLTIDSGASWAFAGASTLTQTITNNGTINETAGTLTIAGSLSGTGTIDLGAAPLTLNGSVAVGQAIHFSGTGETLDLGQPGGFAGTLTGFTLGDTIDLTNIGTSEITKLSFVGGVLTISETSGSIHLTFASPGTFTGDKFVDVKDGAGTAITLASTAAKALFHAAALPDLAAPQTVPRADLAHGNAPVTLAPANGGVAALQVVDRPLEPVWSILKVPLG